MNREEKKQYLNSYLELKREIDVLIEDYHFWEETSKSVPIANLQNLGIHSGKRTEPLTTHIDICIEIADKIELAKLKLEEILSAIDTVSNADQRSVLKYRYVNGLYFYEIARKMHFSLDHTYRTHLRALDNVKMPSYDK